MTENNGQELNSAWEFNCKDNRKYAYFAVDGSYGDATEILVVDVTEWTDEDWNEGIEYASDMTRTTAAKEIAAKRGGFRPPLAGFDKHLTWDRPTLAENGYPMTDEQWNDFTHTMSKMAEAWFTENGMND